jgi:hypothetical protein
LASPDVTEQKLQYWICEQNENPHTHIDLAIFKNRMANERGKKIKD